MDQSRPRRLIDVEPCVDDPLTLGPRPQAVSGRGSLDAQDLDAGSALVATQHTPTTQKLPENGARQVDVGGERREQPAAGDLDDLRSGRDADRQKRSLPRDDPPFTGELARTPTSHHLGGSGHRRRSDDLDLAELHQSERIVDITRANQLFTDVAFAPLPERGQSGELRGRKHGQQPTSAEVGGPATRGQLPRFPDGEQQHG